MTDGLPIYLLKENNSVIALAVWMVASSDPELPSPSQFDWKWNDGTRVPVWMTLPEFAETTSKQVTKCMCKGDCNSCSCGKANVDCTFLCRCNCPK